MGARLPGKERFLAGRLACTKPFWPRRFRVLRGTPFVDMRAAIYHRASTLDQNPALAREELRAAAVRHGFEVAVEVEETGSGARNDRPGLQHVMREARRGKLDAVLVWKLDRFGRSALDLLANIRALESAGVRFIATTQGIDIRPGGDAMGRLLVTMLAAVAEFERDLIRERTRLGLARARASGRKLGRPQGSTPRRPARAEVERLRDRGLTWTDIARALRCSPSTARRAVAA